MKVVKIVGIVVGYILSMCLVGVLGFYLAIMSGRFTYIQETWISSAMTTKDNQWLATKFIAEDRINYVMTKNKVKDAHLKTNKSMVGKRVEHGFGDINTYWFEEDKLEALSAIGNNKMLSYDDTVELQMERRKERDYQNRGYIKKQDGIYFKECSGEGWKGYLLLVEDPSRISLAQTSKQYNCGETVEMMVNKSGALFGINAGGFSDGPNYDSNGGTPAGLLIVGGKVVCPNYETDREYSTIGFNSDNVLVLDHFSSKEAINNNIRDCVNFKPFLIVNGEKTIKEGSGGWGIAPRTAIGQTANGEVIFLCVDGRQIHSIGSDLRDLQDTLYEEKCINAAMVDGGSSTVMYSKEEGFLNKPSLGYERYINNCWIIK